MNAKKKLNGLHEAGEISAPMTPARPGPASLRGDEQPVVSPAQQLQQALGSEFQADPIRKWPPLGRVGFIVGSGGLLWALIILAVRAL